MANTVKMLAPNLLGMLKSKEEKLAHDCQFARIEFESVRIVGLDGDNPRNMRIEIRSKKTHKDGSGGKTTVCDSIYLAPSWQSMQDTDVEDIKSKIAKAGSVEDLLAINPDSVRSAMSLFH